ncbi:MAG: phosphatase PAP2 family protein [Polyangiales bacterium]
MGFDVRASHLGVVARAWFLGLCLVVSLLHAPDVLADDAAVSAAGAPVTAHRLNWSPAWPYFRPIGYVLTGASVVGALAATLLFDYPSSGRWHGGILFDDWGRDTLRAHNQGARDVIRLASDFTLISNVVQISLIDSTLLPFLDRNPGIAAQLTLINAQAFALNIFIATVLFKAVARERPLIPDCKNNPGFDPLCDSGQYASFPSSHTSTAFTAAGLTCVHHKYLPLYGGAWDMAACIESIAVAAATGIFRVIGDRHYLSDVIIGAAIGFSIGYIYPWLLHYRTDSKGLEAKQGSEPKAAVFNVVPAPTGMAVIGAF